MTAERGAGRVVGRGSGDSGGGRCRKGGRLDYVTGTAVKH